MKKLFLSFLLMCGMCSLSHATMVQTIIVNGVEVAGKSVASMTFSGDDAVIVYSDNSSETAPIEQVKILFAYGATGISKANQTGVFDFKGVVNDKLTVNGIPAGTKAVLYDANGRQCQAVVAEADGLSINMNGKAAGVYMLKVGSQVVKFIKK